MARILVCSDCHKQFTDPEMAYVHSKDCVKETLSDRTYFYFRESVA